MKYMWQFVLLFAMTACVASIRVRTELANTAFSSKAGSLACEPIRAAEYFESKVNVLGDAEGKERVRMLLGSGQLLFHVKRHSNNVFFPKPYQDATGVMQCGYAMLSTSLAVSITCVPGEHMFLFDANLCTIHAGAVSQHQLKSGNASLGRYSRSWSQRERYLKKLMKDPSPTTKCWEGEKTRLEWLRDNEILLSEGIARLLNNSARKGGCGSRCLTAVAGTSSFKEMVPFDPDKEYSSTDVPFMPSPEALLSQLLSTMEDRCCNEILADCPEDSVVGALKMTDPRASGGSLLDKGAVEKELRQVLNTK